MTTPGAGFAIHGPSALATPIGPRRDIVFAVYNDGQPAKILTIRSHFPTGGNATIIAEGRREDPDWVLAETTAGEWIYHHRRTGKAAGFTAGGIMRHVQDAIERGLHLWAITYTDYAKLCFPELFPARIEEAR